MKHGDIYRYTPASRWCRHGIAMVRLNDLGQPSAYDTYWNHLTDHYYSDSGYVRLEELKPEDFIGNRDEFVAVDDHNWRQYADKDRLYIPAGGGSEEHYIRRGATKDKEIATEFLNYRIEDERSKIRSAEWKIADLQREIEKLATVDQVS